MYGIARGETIIYLVTLLSSQIYDYESDIFTFSRNLQGSFRQKESVPELHASLNPFLG